jgi:asparagine synthase (glutamine-hydrolysing)
MCGIAGYFAPSGGALNRHVIEAMSATLVHRGPDDDGVWLDPEAGIALGHRRLAILDLSKSGAQPMACHAGRYRLIFNGEIYNHGEIRRRLETEAVPPQWRGHSDTEVMLEAIARYGIARALGLFNGMFAFALWDREERALTLARDRIGEKPLYYGWCRRSFLFGSELKALKAHPDWQGEVDRGALALLLRRAYVPQPHSIYQGIFKLPPGCILTLKARDASPGTLPQPRAYWPAKTVAEEAANKPFGGEDALGELEARLSDAIRLRMVADRPLGAFLSGGVDSSAVVALMQKASTRPVKTFTIGFHDARLDEAPFAREVARHLGTDHTELYVSEADALAVVPRLAAIYDEPFADISGIPTVLLSELTRRHVTVSLSGDGGDELFGGYPRYARAAREWRAVGLTPKLLRASLRRAAEALPAGVLNRALGPLARPLSAKARPSRPGNKLRKRFEAWGAASAEELFATHVTQWREVSPGALVIGAETPVTVFEDPGRRADLPSPDHRFMYLDAISYLPDDILVKLDRASMAFGLEARLPLLDHRVVELAWSLPLEARRQKGLLRRLLYQYVPRELIERAKAGFEPPIGDWLRGSLRDWAEDLLSSARLAEGGLFEPRPIRARWQEHLDGARNWHLSLWPVLMFQAWKEGD